MKPRTQLQWHRFDELSADQLYQMLQFRQAIFVVEQASPYPDLDGFDHRAMHLLLHSESELAGYLRLIPHPDEARVAIGRVAIAASGRGQGLARRMMEEALEQCQRNHPGWPITLSAQGYLVPFYQSLGFRLTSAPYEDYGVPHVDMAL